MTTQMVYKNNKKASLSVCMIVRDEEQLLSGCLESVLAIADQIVVVDTGSLDGTENIARRFGAEVYSSPWKNDFAAARNVSLSYATGDWILWLDADERLMPESLPLLTELCQPELQPVIYNVNIKNLQKDGRNYALSRSHRLFSNRPGMRFSGQIHEQISPAAFKIGAIERDADLWLYHLGYSYTGAQAEKKEQRNRKILENYVICEPENAFAHFTLAQHYALHGEFQKALRHYQKAEALKQFGPGLSAALYNAMGDAQLRLNDIPAARLSAQQSVNLWPVQAGAYYLMYKVATAGKDDNEIIAWLENLETNLGLIEISSDKLPSDLILDHGEVLNTLGVYYRKTGQLQPALAAFERAAAFPAVQTTARKNLIDLSLQTGQYDLAGEHLGQLIKTTGETTDLLKILAFVLIKQEKYREAIAVYERLLALDRSDPETIRRLVGLYGKIGELAKAQDIYRYLVQPA